MSTIARIGVGLFVAGVLFWTAVLGLLTGFVLALWVATEMS